MKLLNCILFAGSVTMVMPAGAACLDFLNTSRAKLNSTEQVDLCELTQGKTVLIVNTASKCGFTPQFSELEQLHKKHQGDGLVVLGFPSDDFFQENKQEQDTANVCYINYGVTFTMLAPVSVRGENADPIFKYLAEQSASPKWNFYKYLISADGQKVQHFTSTTKPSSDVFQQTLKKMLK